MAVVTQSISMPEDMHRRLKEQAEKEKRKISTVVRRALRLYFEEVGTEEKSEKET
ncbi:MAG: ribbon-helix-helix protein, CopG family [Candidatus Hadarchaeota archaeon]|nr:ribbon-helix-helix protein, CopG family [Candidatus Hadarchaeota archaeon]